MHYARDGQANSLNFRKLIWKCEIAFCWTQEQKLINNTQISLTTFPYSNNCAFIDTGPHEYMNTLIPLMTIAMCLPFGLGLSNCFTCTLYEAGRQWMQELSLVVTTCLKVFTHWWSVVGFTHQRGQAWILLRSLESIAYKQRLRNHCLHHLHPTPNHWSPLTIVSSIMVLRFNSFDINFSLCIGNWIFNIIFPFFPIFFVHY